MIPPPPFNPFYPPCHECKDGRVFEARWQANDPTLREAEVFCWLSDIDIVRGSGNVYVETIYPKTAQYYGCPVDAWYLHQEFHRDPQYYFRCQKG